MVHAKDYCIDIEQCKLAFVLQGRMCLLKRFMRFYEAYLNLPKEGNQPLFQTPFDQELI